MSLSSATTCDFSGIVPAAAAGHESRQTQAAWRILAIALALTVLEGAIRKWLIGSTFHVWSYLAYFSKDLVFALLLLLPSRFNPAPAVQTFRRWLIPGTVLLILGAIASSTEALVFEGAILTARAAILLPVLALLVASRVYGVSLQSVAMILSLFAVANFLLGIAQNQLPAGHLLNRYAADVPNIVATESGVRATGTFSYITGMAVFSVVGVWAGMVYLSLARNLRQQLFAFAAIASGIGCGLASVSRGPLVMEASMLAIWLFASRNWHLRKSGAVLAAAVVVGLTVLLGLTTTFTDLSQGLANRVHGSEDTVHERALAQFDEALVALDLAPFGNGFGSEQVGRYAFSGKELVATSFESQLPRIILEVGFIGLIGFLTICAGALAALQQAKRYTDLAGEKAALLATQLFLIFTIASNIVFNHIASAFVWIIFAVVLASTSSRRA